MAAVFFNLKVTWPSITNDIRVSVYSPLDLNTPIASQQQNAPHLDQQYSFPGLPRQNFVYKVLETAINGSTIISQLGQASFVAANDTLQVKDPVLVEVGSTDIPGTSTPWPSGVTTVTVPDWIGWELEASGRPAQYPFKRDPVNEMDITWDSATGVLTLMQPGDQFQDGEFLYFEFQPIVSASSGGVPPPVASGGGFTDVLVITADTTLTLADLGKKVIINPAGNYVEVTLPDFTTAEANKITWFEMNRATGDKCARIKTYSGQPINWQEVITDLYICPNESIELYKRVVVSGTYQWRVQNPFGNFLDAGTFVYSDLPPAQVFNMIEANGANRDYLQYARLYNRYVVRTGTAISYSTWNSVNPYTRIKFSLKDSLSNNFRVADLQTIPLFLRPKGALGAGDYKPAETLEHQHLMPVGTVRSDYSYGRQRDKQGTAEWNGTGSNYQDLTSRAVKLDIASGLWRIVDGSEGNPNSRATYIYIKI